MAIDALLHAGTKFSHDYHHDLESLFYVICWICTMYSGPNGKMRKESEYKSSHRAFFGKNAGAEIGLRTWKN